MAQHVILEHAPAGAARLDLFGLDPVLCHDAARCRRDPYVGAVAGAVPDSVSGRLAGFGDRANGGPGWQLSRRSFLCTFRRGCRRLLHVTDDLSHRCHFAFFLEHSGHGARRRSGQLHRDLVRFDHHERIVALHAIAFRLEPLADLDFGDGLTHLGYFQL